MHIDIKTLEKAMVNIFEHLRSAGIDTVELKKDFYWDIATEERYDPYKDPTDISLGQLSDNWNEIEKIACGEKEPLGYALVWIAALSRYIGETTPG